MPNGSVLALPFKLAVTWTDVPAASVPPVGATFSQAEVLTNVQVNAPAPVFVRTSNWEVMSNGPPTSPRLVNPVAGVMRSTSGTSKDSWTPAVVVLEGDVALKPRPRLAKPAHNSGRFAPPLLMRSA